MNENVLLICMAYEQGLGHGLKQRSLKNPYNEGTDEYDAWQYGYYCGEYRAGIRNTNNKVLY